MNPVFDLPEFQIAFREAAEAAGFAASVLAELEEGPLMAWERTGEGPRVYFSAGMHGDEPAGPLALLELARAGFFTGPVHWLLCPALNPAGLAGGNRENADGVDLNRDYWARATREVAAHAAWLDARPAPALFISLHEDWETSGFYFYEINLGADDPQRTRRIIAATSPWFLPEPGPQIDGHEPREPGWIYHEAEPDLPEGWPEAIHLAKMGCPLSFTFETPSRAPLASRVAAQVAAVKAACECVLGQIR
jgi:hypothetical protein